MCGREDSGPAPEPGGVPERGAAAERPLLVLLGLVTPERRSVPLERFLGKAESVWDACAWYARERGLRFEALFRHFGEGVRTVVRPDGGGTFIAFPRGDRMALRRYLREAREKTAIAVTHNKKHGVLKAAARLKAGGARVVHFVRNEYDLEDLPFLKRFFFRRYLERVASAVLFNNEDQAAAYRRRIRTPCFVFRHSVDTDVFRPLPRATRSGKVTLLYAGSIAPRKEVLEIADGLALLSPPEKARVRLLVAGAIRPEFQGYAAELDARLAAAGVEREHLGHTPHRTMPEVYARADWTANLRHDEPFGHVFAETLACGTPPIGHARAPGPRGLVRDGETGFLVEGAAGLAATLSRILRGDADGRAMGERGVRFILENHTKEHCRLSLVAALEAQAAV